MLKDLVDAIHNTNDPAQLSNLAGNIKGYLENSQDGLKLRDLVYINQIMVFYIENFECHAETFKQAVIQIFETCGRGFIKEKSFDDKITVPDLTSFFQNLLKVAEFIDIDFENDSFDQVFEKHRICIEICYYGFDFMLHYLICDREIKPSQEAINSNQKTKIEFLASKRLKNRRDCEKILVRDYTFSENNTAMDRIDTTKMQKKFRLEVFEKANIIEEIIYFIQKNSGQLKELTVILLEILNIVAQKTEIAVKMCSLGLCKDLLYIIYDNKDNFKDLLVRMAFEVLWNTIHMLEKTAVSTILTEDIVFIAKEMLCVIISDGYKMEDKTLRNELVVLINYLMDDKTLVETAYEGEESHLLAHMLDYNFKNHNFEKYSLLEILLYICTIDEYLEENKANNKADKRRFFELVNEDLLCKRLVINAIVLALKNTYSDKIKNLIKSSYFIEMLFYYFRIHNGSEIKTMVRYSEQYLKEIQTECLAAFEVVSMVFPDVFLVSDRLKLFLKYLKNTKDNQKSIQILAVFERLASTELKHKIVDVGTIDLLLYYLNGCDRLNNIEDDSILAIKTSCWDIIAKLCDDCKPNQSVFAQKGGVDILVNYFNNPIVIKTERSSLLAVNIFRVLSAAVIGNRKNEDSFLESEGFFILLDFLEKSLKIHRKQTLSSLSGLLDNKRAMRYFDDWTSSATGVNTTQLLLKVYEEEDEKFNVTYDRGILKSVEKPLNPQRSFNQKEEPPAKRKAFASLSRALVIANEEMLTKSQFSNEYDTNNFDSYLISYIKNRLVDFDLRGQVYNIFCKTGFYRNNVTQIEAQRMEVVHNYEELKIGEIWLEIREALNSTGIEPTSEDYAMMTNKIEKMKMLIDGCIKSQEIIEEEKKKVQEEELGKFYELIKNHKK